MMSPEGGAKENLHLSLPSPPTITIPTLVKSQLNIALLARSQLQKEAQHHPPHETSGETQGWLKSCDLPKIHTARWAKLG